MMLSAIVLRNIFFDMSDGKQQFAVFQASFDWLCCVTDKKDELIRCIYTCTNSIGRNQIFI